MFRTFIQVTAIILTLESAIFLARGNLSLTPENIAKLASTKWGYNAEVMKSVSAQCANTWVGVILLLSAFGMQLGVSLWEMRWGDFSTSKGGIVISVVVSVIIFAVCINAANRLTDTFEQNAKKAYETLKQKSG
jgi:tetrahydromethanopterin S-methyltransferase subunit E